MNYKTHPQYRAIVEWSQLPIDVGQWDDERSKFFLDFSRSSLASMELQLTVIEQKAHNLLTVVAALAVIVSASSPAEVSRLVAIGIGLSAVATVATSVCCILALAPQDRRPPVDPEEFFRYTQDEKSKDIASLQLAKCVCASEVSTWVVMQHKARWLLGSYVCFAMSVLLLLVSVVLRWW